MYMTNANKSPKIPYSTVVKEVKKWPGIDLYLGSEHHQKLIKVTPIVTTRFNEIGWLYFYSKHTDSYTHKQNQKYNLALRW